MISPPTKGDATRHRLTESMMHLIHNTGYHGAGLNAVLEHSAAPKGSLYFHFPGGKSQLASAALAVTAERFHTVITDAAAASGSISELVDAIIGELATQLVVNDFRFGCPVAAVTLDAGADDEQLRTACSDAYALWIATLADVLAPYSGDQERTRGIATAVVCLIEGALVVCRAQRSTDPLASAAQAITAMFGAVQGDQR